MRCDILEFYTIFIAYTLNSWFGLTSIAVYTLRGQPWKVSVPEQPMGSPHHIFVPVLTSELNCCELAARLYVQIPYTPMYGVVMMHPLLHSVLERVGCRLGRALTNSFSLQKSITLWQ